MVGVEQDAEQAVHWYQLAAKQGHALAQLHPSHCFYDGDGVEQDDELSNYWFLVAADLGDAYAQNEIKAIGLGDQKKR